MITGIPSIDNGFNDVIENLKKTQKRTEEIIEELKKANRSEKEFLIFKLFFDGLDSVNISDLEIFFKKNPLMFDRVFWLIEEAKKSREISLDASYNRNKYCIEIMNIYRLLLDKMSKLAKELNISNSLELSILFSYLLWNGYLSKTKKQEFKSNDQNEIVGLLFAEITNGIGVCRNYSEMLKDFLSRCGYRSVILENYFGNVKKDYIMDIAVRKNYTPINSDNSRRKPKEPNHVFNLIEDNGLYIYDPTNLLLFELKNINTATLINGKGKNIIYHYRSYDFVYSKDDEQLLDSLFTKDSYVSPYDKTDFISMSEVNLELLRSNYSLLEDFYIDIRPNILSISEETKKKLARIK